MSNGANMKPKQSFTGIEQAVIHELTRAGLSMSDVAVTVDGAVVTMTGFVDNYSDKVVAENAVKRLDSVHGVASDIKVRDIKESTDTEIVKDVIDALKKAIRVPDSKIKVTVRDGWLILEGRVESHYQRDAAEEAIKYI